MRTKIVFFRRVVSKGLIEITFEQRFEEVEKANYVDSQRKNQRTQQVHRV